MLQFSLSAWGPVLFIACHYSNLLPPGLAVVNRWYLVSVKVKDTRGFVVILKCFHTVDGPLLHANIYQGSHKPEESPFFITDDWQPF